MKAFFLFALALVTFSLESRAQATPDETQAVVRQLNQLMRNPKKPAIPRLAVAHFTGFARQDFLLRQDCGTAL